MRHARQPLQSHHAGIRREARRTGTLRDNDGSPAGAAGRDDGYDHGRYGAGWTTRRLLPTPALAGQAGYGYSDGNEKLDCREGIDPERDGKAEAGVSKCGAGALAREMRL